LSPLTPLEALYFSLLFFLSLLSLGRALRILVRGLLGGGSLGDHGFLDSLGIDLSLGTALIPLLTLLLTSLGHLLNRTSVYLLLLSSLALVLLHTLRERGGGDGLRGLSRELPLLSILVLSLLLRLIPSLGLYVHGGDDPKLYSLLTLRILEEGGYTQSWGRYTLPGWNIVRDSHLFMEGFEALAAFFHLLTGVAVPKVVLLTTMLYSGLTPLSLYVLAKKLYRAGRTAAFSSLLIGVVSPTPLLFAEWGGHGEIVAAYFLLPATLSLMLNILRGGRGREDPVLASVLMAGMLLTQVLSVVYLLAFLLPILLRVLLRRDVRSLGICLLPLAASILLVSPLYVPALLESLGSTEVLPPGIFGWGAAEEYTFLKRYDLPHSLLDLPLLCAHLWSPTITLLGLLGLLSSWRRNRAQGFYLASWCFLLFLINENNPFGLYHIKFPLWNLLFPERFALAMVLPLTLLGGLGLNRLQEALSGFKPRWRSLSLVVVLLLLLPDAAYRCVQMSRVPLRASPVTGEDMEAFLWIGNHTPEDALFFVSDADAGQWIPVFTGRRVFPLETVMNNPEMVILGRNLTRLSLQTPSDPRIYDLLRENGIDYIYIGAKAILDKEKFNETHVQALLDTGRFRVVYPEGDHPTPSPVTILEVSSP